MSGTAGMWAGPLSRSLMWHCPSGTGSGRGLCIFEPVCGQALALEHNGDLYACDHYVQPDYLLGNILEMPLAELAVSPRQQAFGLHKEKKPAELLPRV